MAKTQFGFRVLADFRLIFMALDTRSLHPQNCHSNKQRKLSNNTMPVAVPVPEGANVRGG